MQKYRANDQAAGSNNTCRQLLGGLVLTVLISASLSAMPALSAPPIRSGVPDVVDKLLPAPAQPTPPDTTGPAAPKAGKPRPPLRTLAPLDSLGRPLPSDSTGLHPDSLAADTLPPPPPPIVPPDTLEPEVLIPAGISLTQREWHHSGFKDAGEAMLAFPGLYGRQYDMYGHPFYLVPPGGNARDLGVLYNGRSFAEPVTGAVNWTSIVAEDIQRADYSSIALPQLPSSGPVIHWLKPWTYDEIPVSRVVYRQGWYGLGHADVRLAQQLSPALAYHFGINIGEFQGRYNNTDSQTSHLRFGARRTLRGIGILKADWMQLRAGWGRPYSGARMSYHRHDLDLSLSSGDSDSSGIWQEAAFWYVRSTSGYGYADEDGNRLGGRLEAKRTVLTDHKLRARLDVERTAARFPRRTRNIDPQARRWVYGLSLTDQVERGRWSVQGSLRSEYATVALEPDTMDVDPTFLNGGSLAAEYRLWERLKLIGLLSSSWRYPGLDELGGYWSVRSPDRAMDVFAVPDFTVYSLGNPALDPVKTDFVGGGAKLDWWGFRQVYFMSGVRNWRDRIQTTILDEETWSRTNLPDTQTFETTAYAWVPIYGPVSVAATWTWAERIASNAAVPQMQGTASLRFTDFYYNGQLRIRATANLRYLGGYASNEFAQPEVTLLETLINAKVFDFELYYGTSNILGAAYQFIPYYPNVHRTELWGVRWVLYR